MRRWHTDATPKCVHADDLLLWQDCNGEATTTATTVAAAATTMTVAAATTTATAAAAAIGTTALEK